MFTSAAVFCCLEPMADHRSPFHWCRHLYSDRSGLCPHYRYHSWTTSSHRHGDNSPAGFNLLLSWWLCCVHVSLVAQWIAVTFPLMQCCTCVLSLCIFIFVFFYWLFVFLHLQRYVFPSTNRDEREKHPVCHEPPHPRALQREERSGVGRHHLPVFISLVLAALRDGGPHACGTPAISVQPGQSHRGQQQRPDPQCRSCQVPSVPKALARWALSLGGTSEGRRSLRSLWVCVFERKKKKEWHFYYRSWTSPVMEVSCYSV